MEGVAPWMKGTDHGHSLSRFQKNIPVAGNIRNGFSIPLSEPSMEPLKTQTIPFGDSHEFHDIFAALYPRLVSYARRYGATYPEDIAQEAFVILMQRESPVEHPTAYLRTPPAEEPVHQSGSGGGTRQGTGCGR
jgi:hypothetical protein